MTGAITSDPQRVADHFVAVLREWLTPAELATVRARNAHSEYAHACASHDFCDANMAMLEALMRSGLLARPANPMDDANYDHDAIAPVWNAAWDLARAQHLIVTAYCDEQAIEEPDAVAGLGSGPEQEGLGYTEHDGEAYAEMVRDDLAGRS